MEAGKSHDLPSTSWEARKDSGIIPVQVWKPGNQGKGSRWYKSQSKGIWWMSQFKQGDKKKKGQIHLYPAFCLFSLRLDDAIHTGKDNPL